MSNQESKLALVTGGSRGIGRATAYELARQGYIVAVHYRADGDAAEQTLAGIRELGGSGFAIQADLDAPDGVATLFAGLDRAAAKLGLPATLDVLVNNAGVADGGALDDTSVELFDRQFTLNVKAVFFATQQAVKRMPRGGRIVNLSSVLSSRVFEAGGHFSAISAYAASKAAVDTLTRHWAVELGPRGILVNAVAPGPVDTDMNATWLRTDEGRSTMIGASPLGRVGKPEDIAGVIGFLVSSASQWTTGQVIDASGGYRL
ncbi:MAG: putative oxidoreductase YgfF [Burkholderia lata]|uniref:Putative oxidoreductase YgfF n=1 Tax=Burkholderia lata (strain ATCC 17760 / DSM 23089 / LMG 22485 / NCIMB 9086 / R18194 / 383) TaxID=482957 RepID=A0A833UZY4_BURL3|nr:SDR family oxidoreductase [Burkholderia lata]KAF1034000.1 MAG: putative oxidoreductase YgfF [Burkholderia lata]